MFVLYRHNSAKSVIQTRCLLVETVFRVVGPTPSQVIDDKTVIIIADTTALSLVQVHCIEDEPDKVPSCTAYIACTHMR